NPEDHAVGGQPPRRVRPDRGADPPPDLGRPGEAAEAGVPTSRRGGEGTGIRLTDAQTDEDEGGARGQAQDDRARREDLGRRGRGEEAGGAGSGTAERTACSAGGWRRRRQAETEGTSTPSLARKATAVRPERSKRWRRCRQRSRRAGSERRTG